MEAGIIWEGSLRICWQPRFFWVALWWPFGSSPWFCASLVFFLSLVFVPLSGSLFLFSQEGAHAPHEQWFLIVVSLAMLIVWALLASLISHSRTNYCVPGESWYLPSTETCSVSCCFR